MYKGVLRIDTAGTQNFRRDKAYVSAGGEPNPFRRLYSKTCAS